MARVWHVSCVLRPTRSRTSTIVMPLSSVRAAAERKPLLTQQAEAAPSVRKVYRMLVLSRKIGQKIVIEGEITVMVTHVAGNRVKLGIEAPDHVRIARDELQEVLDSFADEKTASPTAAKIVADTFGAC